MSDTPLGYMRRLARRQPQSQVWLDAAYASADRGDTIATRTPLGQTAVPWSRCFRFSVSDAAACNTFSGVSFRLKYPRR